MEEDEYNDIVTYTMYTRPKLYFLCNIFSGWKVIMCNVIHRYILILNFFHLIWKIYNSIGRNLILKYCPRIKFYIKNNPPERILWRIKSNVTQTHPVSVTGLYELLGNPTTYLIEWHRPSWSKYIVSCL